VPPRKAAMLTSASFAAIGPIYFVTSNAIAQILHPSANPIRVTVSFLVFGSYGWLQTSAFYILGISFIALAAALVLKINAKLNLGAIVVFLVGVAFILVASNHVQHSTTPITLSEIVHRDSAVAIVVMSPLACFLLAPSLKKSGHRGLWIYSIIAGVITILTIIIGLAIPTAHNSFLGIFERILLLNGQVWGEIVCLRLIWTTFKPKPTQAALDSSHLRLLQIYAGLHPDTEVK
jgi:lysylphosphatidylglycerol synthetase-like protein (DUF2156 family)